MKLFISHSSKNTDFFNKIRVNLKEVGINVWVFTEEIHAGDDMTQEVKKALSEIDYYIIVLSKASVNSEWVNFELSSTLVNEASRQENLIIPILIEECEIPSSLRNRLYIDFRTNYEGAFAQLLKSLRKKKEHQAAPSKFEIKSYEDQLKKLKSAYENGNLTLFCGAGISIDAGIPTWSNLLKSLLNYIFSFDNDVKVIDIDSKIANILQKQINVSPLIVAQYLKNLLGKNFLDKVREVLYKDCRNDSTVIAIIASLSKPKREGKPLKAIITFNFDNLLEEKFKSENILFKTLHKDGDRHTKEEIPIYHPHGFLPREGKLTNENEIVFSEDAYHTQFINQFSWNNLVQLNHLNSTTCLFIGISLTDPNMRRLVDVSARVIGSEEKKHFIVKKRYSNSDMFDNPQFTQEEYTIIKIIEEVEQADASKLGFNLLWINDYKELSNVLKEIND
jgi:TIR domain/SIR2-like domain